MYLDTNILIYLFERHATYSTLVANALEQAASANSALVTSAITVTEFLAGTSSSSLATLQKVPRLEFVSLDEQLGEQAALLQKENNLHIGDAIHLATAVQSGTKTLFTNDKKLANVAQKYLTVKQL